MKLSALHLLLPCLLFPPASRAADFYESGLTARALAVAGAGVASCQSGLDAMELNPAALGCIDRRLLDLNITGLFASGKFTNLWNTDGRLASNAGVIPYGAFTQPLGWKRIVAAVSVTPELLTSAKWNYRDAPGGWGGNASYGQGVQKSSILALRMAGGIAVPLGRKVIVGATIGRVYNTNTLQAPYIFQTNVVLKGFKTALDLETRGYGWDGSVGILARPLRGLQFGLSYKTSDRIRSHGDASGNATNQFTALGLAIPPTFHYKAEVDNVLPRSVRAGMQWDTTSRTRLSLQGDWVNWQNAFVSLPVKLSAGSNAAINSVVGSDSLQDGVPLRWKNQGIGRIGFEFFATESVALRTGYSFGNNPVPASTLTPLTAAITHNTLSAGVGYRRGRYTIDAAYQYGIRATASVGKSELLTGEYDNSRVQVGLQSLAISTGVRF